MDLSAKAAAILLTTFALGAATGAVGAGYLSEHRRPPPPPQDGAGGRPGFVGEMEQLIQPRDSAQALALRPHLEATDQRNREIVGAARASMHLSIDAMRASVASLLDSAQLARVDEFIRRPPPGGPPGLDGRGGRRGGPPPDGRGPPPDGRGRRGGPPV